MKAIVISIALAIIPVAGVAYILLNGQLLTVDGLFMTLILLTIAGIFMLNATLEAKVQGLIRIPGMAAGMPAFATAAAGASGARVVTASRPADSAGTRTEVGIVEQVDYYDAPIGQSNKSVVTFRPQGEKAPKVIILCGNLRGQLLVGRRMQLTYRAGQGCDTLLSFDLR